jgi:hypothetical protein
MACSCGCSQATSFRPSQATRWQIARLIRLPMEAVGELRGVIYRTSRVPGEEPKNYVHFFKDKLPTLVANPSGTRLYIVGGNYRVTSSGIHG